MERITENNAIDNHVSEYGMRLGPVRPIAERSEKLLQNGLDMSLYRSISISQGIGLRPYMRFPDSENVQHYPYPEWAYQAYGDTEREIASVSFVLDQYPQRTMPSSFKPHLLDIDHSMPLTKIPKFLNKAERLGGCEYGKMLESAYREADVIYDNGYAAAYTVDPQFYKVDPETRDIEKILLSSSINQIAHELEIGDTKNINNFLRLYALIKNPINPIFSDDQKLIFAELYRKAIEELSYLGINTPNNDALIMQIAHESSFLSLPGADSKEVKYSKHQELPIVRVDLRSLPRGEFAKGERVIEIVESELEYANKQKKAGIFPLMVSYTTDPSSGWLDGKQKPTLIINDGNNRATAIILIDYLNNNGLDPKTFMHSRNIDNYIVKNGLDLEWEADLVASLKVLSNDPTKLMRFQEFSHSMSLFKTENIPAVLTNEVDFNTVAVEQSDQSGSLVVMGPHNQAIFNLTKLSVGAKKQSHGRATGNNGRIDI